MMDEIANVEHEEQLRGEAPFPDLAGKTVVLVDDGLASGFTVKVAVKAMKHQQADVIVVAVPTAHDQSLRRIAPHVDTIFCPNVRGGWHYAVADAYRDWYDVSEEEAEIILREYRARW